MISSKRFMILEQKVPHRGTKSSTYWNHLKRLYVNVHSSNFLGSLQTAKFSNICHQKEMIIKELINGDSSDSND